VIRKTLEKHHTLQLLSGRSVVRIHPGALQKASFLRGFREALASFVSSVYSVSVLTRFWFWFRSPLVEQLVHLCNGLVLGSLEQMRIGICRRREISVTRPLLNDFQINSRCQHQRRLSVTQIMKHKRIWNSGSHSDRIPDSVVEIRPTHVTTPCIGEDDGNDVRVKPLINRFLFPASQCFYRLSVT